jgi:mitogen-activated protein kinase kinase
MEYCAGRSLDNVYKQVKSRGGRTGERVLGKIACGVLGGLSYLHERKIIHRGFVLVCIANSDIKPSNILITKEGNVKLCDFGVSGELVDSLAGTFTGTSYYMAV